MADKADVKLAGTTTTDANAVKVNDMQTQNNGRQQLSHQTGNSDVNIVSSYEVCFTAGVYNLIYYT